MSQENQWPKVLQVLESTLHSIEGLMTGPDPDGENARLINVIKDQINHIRILHLNLPAIYSHT
jgi:hypothetical protein